MVSYTYLRIRKRVTYIFSQFHVRDMNDNKVQFFKKGKYNTHIYNEYLLMKCSKNIKIRSYAKKAWRKLWWWDKLDVKNFFGKMKPQILRKSLDNDRGMGFCENVLWTNWKKSFTSFKEIYFWSFSNWTPCMKHAIFLFLSFSAQK